MINKKLVGIIIKWTGMNYVLRPINTASLLYTVSIYALIYQVPVKVSPGVSQLVRP